MENLSRVKRKKKEKKESTQKRISGGLTTLRALSDLSRIIDFLTKSWEWLKGYFDDFYL